MRTQLRLGSLIAASFAIVLFALIFAGTPEHAPLRRPPAQTAGVDRPEISGSVLDKAQPRLPLGPGNALPDSRAEDDEFTGEEIARLIAADPDFGRAIEGMLDDPDPEVRRGAAELFNAFLEASSGANEEQSARPARNFD